MSIYGEIFMFLRTYIFSPNNSSYLGQNLPTNTTFLVGGIEYSFIDWLCHTTTIIIMCLCVVLACLLVRWVWRMVSSGFLLRK